MSRHGIFPASFDALDITQIQSVSIQSGTNKSMITPGGAIDTAAVIHTFADPRVSFETHNLGVLSTASPTVGLAVETEAALRYQQRLDGGTFETGAEHLGIGATKGFLYPTRIRSRQDDPNGAVLEMMFVPLYDGTNAILTFDATSDFDSGVPTPAFVAQYFHGPLYIGGVQIPGMQSYDIDFGIEYRTVRQDGQLYPTAGYIVRRRPQIQVTLTNAAYLATRGFFPSAYTSTGVAIYLPKGVHGGDRVAAATTQHAKISSVTGELSGDDLSVQDNGDATHTYTINPSGATPTLAVSVASAIP